MGTRPERRVRGALCALAVAVPLFAGCAGEAESADPGAGSQDATSDLEASAPDGKYAAAYVLESANVPGAKDGAKATSTYAFTFDECTDTQCTGTVKAPAEGSYTWDGTDLVVTFDQIKKTEHCVDDSGKQIKSATIDGTTEHEARLAAAGEGDAAAAKLEGTYEQTTVFDNSRNGCDKGGPDRQQAKFSLVLSRQ